MVRTLKITALASVLIFAAAPAFAAFITLPFVGDIEHPDMDPFHIITPEAPAAPAPAAAPAMKHHHHHHHHMMKKM